LAWWAVDRPIDRQKEHQQHQVSQCARVVVVGQQEVTHTHTHIHTRAHCLEKSSERASVCDLTHTSTTHRIRPNLNSNLNFISLSAAAAMSSGPLAASAAGAAAAAVGATTSPDDDLAGTIKGVGITGSLLYTAMLLLVGWRTRAFFKAGGDGSPPGVFPAKTWFHVFLLASCLSDLPYYYKVREGGRREQVVVRSTRPVSQPRD
jgi:hypothetical protein